MRALIVVAALTIAAPAWAQDREYCPTRPGLGTPSCTMAPGKVSVETALADWTRDDQPDSRTDKVLIADTVVRVGATDSSEMVFGWTPYGHVRTRDKMSGAIDQAGAVGDVTLGFKKNFANPDGNGLSFAVLPFVKLPVGRSPVGAGDWGAGAIAPVTYDLTEIVNIEFTPEIDAAVNQSGTGRHLAYSGIAGIDVKLAKAIQVSVELQGLRDEDPSQATTQTLAGLALAWMAKDDLQIDAGAVAGLSSDAPAVRVYAGLSRRF